MNQKIKEERMNIDIVDRIKQIEIQENEIERRRKELGRQQKCQKTKVVECSNIQTRHYVRCDMLDISKFYPNLVLSRCPNKSSSRG